MPSLRRHTRSRSPGSGLLVRHQVLHLRGDLVVGEAIKTKHLAVGQLVQRGQPTGERVIGRPAQAHRRQDQQSGVGGDPTDVLHDVQRRTVGPLQVVDPQNDQPVSSPAVRSRPAVAPNTAARSTGPDGRSTSPRDGTRAARVSVSLPRRSVTRSIPRRWVRSRTTSESKPNGSSPVGRTIPCPWRTRAVSDRGRVARSARWRGVSCRSRPRPR